MKTISILSLTAAVIFLLLLLLMGSFYYKTQLELTPVVTDVSDYGEAELTIYMVGEPAWPFGPTDCRFVLYVAGERVVKYDFSIHEDGTPASAGNFSVTWKQDYVEILVRASEQYAQTYILCFDGTVGVRQEDYF